MRTKEVSITPGVQHTLGIRMASLLERKEDGSHGGLGQGGPKDHLGANGTPAGGHQQAN